MRYRWFYPWGWIYRPASLVGALLQLVALLFVLQAFLAVDAHAHSVTDTLYGWYPYTISTWLLFAWIASRTSSRRGG